MSCAYCKVSLRIVDETIGKCKCGLTYCKKHRLPEEHACVYDYKKDRAQIEKIVANKISLL